MSDDRYSLDRLMALPAQVPTVMPTSGLVCPKCGFEAKLETNGMPSESVWYKDDRTGERISPLFHAPCVARVYAERDVAYLTEHLGTWIPKDEYERRQEDRPD